MDRREAIRLAAVGILAAAATPRLGGAAAEAPHSPSWRLQRLSWAGLRLEMPETTLFIDPWISPSSWDGSWKAPIVPLESSNKKPSVLITHLHNDHFDPAALKQLIGEAGQVICHAPAAAGVASRGFRVRAVEAFHPEEYGEFLVMPVPASDGFGESQVSWIVMAGGKRLIHCGDTLWHGSFELYGRAYGPFDYAFLPINGAVIHRAAPFSDVPATLMPKQAVAAAVLLRARTLVPIHYGVSDDTYREQPAALAEVRREAEAKGVTLQIVPEGGWVTG